MKLQSHNYLLFKLLTIFFFNNLKFVGCRKTVFIENIHFAVPLTQPTGMATLLTSLPVSSPCHGVSVTVKEG